MFIGTVVGLTACGNGNTPPSTPPEIVKPVDPPVDPGKKEPGDVVEASAYAEIAKVAKTLMESKGKTNVEILSIFSDSEGYLAIAEKDDDGYASYSTDVEIGTTLESAKSVDTSALAESSIYKLNSFTNGAYVSTESDMVQKMVDKLLGEGYNVMFGSISNTSKNGLDTQLGDNSLFTVCAFLEKDGVVSEYSQTLAVAEAYDDVYQTVLTKEQSDTVYKSESKTNKDLGEVAKNYIAEEKRVE